jgi:hypothetical protein
VVSARGKATDEHDILTIAAKTEITNHFRSFKTYQKGGFDAVD